MKYPDMIQLGGNQIRVNVVAQPLEQTGPHSYRIGAYHPVLRTITIYHDDRIVDTCGECFVHETVEAINGLYDLNLPHQTITTLATALYQAFSSADVSFVKEQTWESSYTN